MLGVQYRCEIIYMINSLLVIINFSLDFHKNRILEIWWEIQFNKTCYFSLCAFKKCAFSAFRYLWVMCQYRKSKYYIVKYSHIFFSRVRTFLLIDIISTSWCYKYTYTHTHTGMLLCHFLCRWQSNCYVMLTIRESRWREHIIFVTFSLYFSK